MFIGGAFCRFQFNDDFLETNQIGNVGVSKWLISIRKRKAFLGFERDFLVSELNFHAV